MRRRTKKEEEEKVEEILEAAQAMMLLQLNTQSHVVRSGSDSLSPDLSRRFDALKAPPGTDYQPRPRAPTGPDAGAKAIPDEEMKGVLGEDLSARFEALKASSSSSAGDSSGLDQRNRWGDDDSSGDGDVDEEGVSKKEVEKLMEWARDAARLDPSPPSDDDGENGKQFDVKECGTSDSDDELTKKKSSGKDLEKKKKKKKLWF